MREDEDRTIYAVGFSDTWLLGKGVKGRLEWDERKRLRTERMKEGRNRGIEDWTLDGRIRERMTKGEDVKERRDRDETRLLVEGRGEEEEDWTGQ